VTGLVDPPRLLLIPLRRINFGRDILMMEVLMLVFSMSAHESVSSAYFRRLADWRG
jgi:hypothetical protein